MYLSIPIVSTMLDSGRWYPWRRSVAVAGTCLSSTAFAISSFSNEVWQLIVLQGILAAVGGAMLYSPSIMFVDEWFGSGSRAMAYGVQLSSKNIVGAACPLLMSTLLDRLGFGLTLRVWAAIVLALGLFGIWMVPKAPAVESRRSAKVPWSFLKHRTFYIYALANLVFSSGYGLPQTYISVYASNVLHFSNVRSSMILALLNVPGIISTVGFGLLSDRLSISASVNTSISALGSSLSALIFWGLKSHQVPALLISFAITYGFFSGGFSSTWGGWIKDLEQEALTHNEAIHTATVYGLLNGARGIGYVLGGFMGVELLQAGAIPQSRTSAYGTKYGSLILFTGMTAAFGGWSTAWKLCSRPGPFRSR